MESEAARAYRLRLLSIPGLAELIHQDDDEPNTINTPFATPSSAQTLEVQLEEARRSLAAASVAHEAAITTLRADIAAAEARAVVAESRAAAAEAALAAHTIRTNISGDAPRPLASEQHARAPCLARHSSDPTVESRPNPVDADRSIPADIAAAFRSRLVREKEVRTHSLLIACFRPRPTLLCRRLHGRSSEPALRRVLIRLSSLRVVIVLSTRLWHGFSRLIPIYRLQSHIMHD